MVRTVREVNVRPIKNELSSPNLFQVHWTPRTRFATQMFVQLRTGISSSDMGRDVRSFMLSIQHFLCQPRHCPPSKVPWRMVLERLLWSVTCPNHASFHLLAVVRKGSCGPTSDLILLSTLLLVLCSKWEMQRSFLRHLVSKAWILFSESASSWVRWEQAFIHPKRCCCLKSKVQSLSEHPIHPRATLLWAKNLDTVGWNVLRTISEACSSCRQCLCAYRTVNKSSNLVSVFDGLCNTFGTISQNHVCIEWRYTQWLLSFFTPCSRPSQPQRITSGIKKKLQFSVLLSLLLDLVPELCNV